MKLTGLMAAATLAAPLAMADIQITMLETKGGSRGQESVISIRDGMVAMQSAGDSGHALFNAKTREFTQIDHDSRSYIVMDQESMNEAADQMSAMMKQMEAQLAQLPAEQREAMMKMMPGMAKQMGNKEAAPPTRVEWTGDKDEVAGYKCRVAEIVDPDGDRTTACVAKASELGMSDADFESVAMMFETMQDFARRFNSRAPMPTIDDLEGVPVRSQDADGSTITLVSVDKSKLDDELFSIPGDYTKRSMMDMGR